MSSFARTRREPIARFGGFGLALLLTTGPVAPLHALERAEFARDAPRSLQFEWRTSAAVQDARALRDLALANLVALDAGAGDDLRVEDERRAGGGLHVRLRQFWRQWPLLDGELTMFATSDGRVFVLGHVVPAPGRMWHEPVNAGALAPGRIRPPVGWAFATDDARTWLVRRNGEDRLVRERALMAGDRRARGYLDDRTGGWLGIEDEGAPAPAWVFAEDGRDTLTRVELDGLPAQPTRLAGRYVRVIGPDGTAWERIDSDFRVAPTEPDTTHFDEAHAYWHADSFFRAFASRFGYTPSAPVTIYPRRELFPLTAYTSGQYVYLGRAVDRYYRDTAKARDLIAHELMHTMLLARSVQSGGPNREASALHEGVSDFGAAAYTRDPALMDWVFPAYPGGITRVDSPASEFHYANYDRVRFGGVAVGSAWANGMIFSGALWDLRTRIGDRAMALLVEALDFIPSLPNFREFAAGMLAADQALHAGEDQVNIAAAFRGRGIEPTLTHLAIEGPTSLAEPGVARFAVAGIDSSVASEVVWSTRPLASPGAATHAWVPVASGPTLERFMGEDSELLVEVPGTLARAQAVILVGGPLVRLIRLPLDGDAQSSRWLARATGAMPFTFTWWAEHASGSNAPRDTGPDSIKVLQTGSSAIVNVLVQDAFGREATDSERVVPRYLAILGPDPVRPGDAVELTAAASGYSEPLTFQWRVQPLCGRLPCGSAFSREGARLVYADTLDASITLEMRSADSTTAMAERFLSVRPPLVAIAAEPDQVEHLPFSATATGTGVEPLSWHWTVTDLFSGGVIAIGTGPSTPPMPLTATVRISFLLRDAFGREARVTRDFSPVRLSVRAELPAERGGTARLLAQVHGASPGRTVRWNWWPDGEAPACTSGVSHEDIGDTLTLQDSTVVRARVRVERGGRTLAAHELTVALDLPRLRIEGPTSGDAAHVETWVARASGAEPFTYEWLLSAPGRGPRSGYGDLVQFAPDTTVSLRFSAIDRRGTRVAATIDITGHTVPDSTPILEPGSLAFSAKLTHVAAGMAEFALMLPAAGSGQVVLFDPQGRLMKRLHLGVRAAGAHVIRVPLGELRKGIYFYNVRTTLGSASGRLALTD